jgi:RNA polymerase sporulation-specific sigma factor
MNNEFIEEYSKLIYSLTHYFEGYQHKEDLYQAGCLGLMMAYQNFDESYGVKFSTYAYSYILGEMKKLVREDKGLRVSKNLIKLNLQIERVKVELEQRLMREPTIKEIAEFLDLEVEELEEATQVIQNLVSLDMPIVTDGKEMILSDFISSHDMDLDTLIAFKEELQNLTPLEKRLLEKRYMESRSQSEVALEFGMNQVQVSRMEKKIKEKMKTRLVA